MPNFIIKVKETGAKKADTNVKGLNRSLGSLKSSAMMAAGAFLGAGALIAGIKGAVNAFGEQELAEKKLEASLGKTSQALLNQAAALQQVSVFGDETIIAAQAMIAAFVKDEDQIKLATQATLDLAAAKGMDLVTAADLVSKTLGSSTNAMSRYGIEVKGAVGSSERLASLTENVGKTFGGQALAQSQTMTGSITQMNNAVGDAAESIGELLAPSIIKAAGFFKGASEAVGGYLTSLKTLSPEEIKLSASQDDLVERIEKTRGKMELLNQQMKLQGSSVSSELGKGLGDSTSKYQELEDQLNALQIQYSSLSMVVTAPQTGFMENHKEHMDAIAEKKRVAEEFAAAEKEIADKKIADDLLIVAAKKKTDAELAASKAKSLKDDLKSAALSGQSASESMKSVVRAKLMEGIASAMASVFKNPLIPFPLNMVAAAGVGGVLTAAVDRNMAMIPSFATGGDFVTSGEQIIRVGDNPSGRERVQVTPLDAGGEPTGGGGSVQINFSGNVMSQDFIENEAIPMIQAAVRRGASLEGA
tara:strand:+ start:3150 stop:4745 length:1596 start_codon:yes stop_codon:yes gene_type:complete